MYKMNDPMRETEAYLGASQTIMLELLANNF